MFKLQISFEGECFPFSRSKGFVIKFQRKTVRKAEVILQSVNFVQHSTIIMPSYKAARVVQSVRYNWVLFNGRRRMEIASRSSCNGTYESCKTVEQVFSRRLQTGVSF